MRWRYILLGVSLVLNLLLVWALLRDGQGIQAYESLKDEAAELRLSIEALGRENMDLSRQIRLLKSDKGYIEQMIRDRLNFVRDNEIWYIFPEDEAEMAGEVADEPKN